MHIRHLFVFAFLVAGCGVSHLAMPDAGTPSFVDDAGTVPVSDAAPAVMRDAGFYEWPDAGPVPTPVDAGSDAGPTARFAFCENALEWSPSYFGFDGCCAVEGSFPTADHVAPGMLVRGESRPYVFYISDDGRRYIFSSSHYLASWYLDASRDLPFGEDAHACSQVVQVPDEVLASVTIGGSVPIRPGVLTVGIITDPKRYVLDHGNALRWIDDPSQDLHLAEPWLRGRDIYTPDAYFVNFCVGAQASDTVWRGVYDGQRLYDEATIQYEIDRHCGH